LGIQRSFSGLKNLLSGMTDNISIEALSEAVLAYSSFYDKGRNESIEQYNALLNSLENSMSSMQRPVKMDQTAPSSLQHPMASIQNNASNMESFITPHTFEMILKATIAIMHTHAKSCSYLDAYKLYSRIQELIHNGLFTQPQVSNLLEVIEPLLLHVYSVSLNHNSRKVGDKNTRNHFDKSQISFMICGGHDIMKSLLSKIHSSLRNPHLVWERVIIFYLACIGKDSRFNLQGAFFLFNQLKDLGWVPSQGTYHAMMRKFTASTPLFEDSMATAIRLQIQISLLNSMKRSGVALNADSYLPLFISYSKLLQLGITDVSVSKELGLVHLNKQQSSTTNNESSISVEGSTNVRINPTSSLPNKLPSWSDLEATMLSEGILHNDRSMRLILSLLLQEGKFDEVVAKMHAIRYAADNMPTMNVSLYNLLIQTASHSASASEFILSELSLGMAREFPPIRPNAETYLYLLKCCYRTRNLTRCVQIIDEMDVAGFLVSQVGSQKLAGRYVLSLVFDGTSRSVVEAYGEWILRKLVAEDATPLSGKYVEPIFLCYLNYPELVNEEILYALLKITNWSAASQRMLSLKNRLESINLKK
jgi:hypothetical protein